MGAKLITKTPVLLVFCLMVSGCIHKRLFQRLGRADADMRQQQDLIKNTLEVPAKRLDWSTACRLLLAQNERLNGARYEHENLRRKRRTFIIDEVNPRISAIANLSSALGELSHMDDRDRAFRLYADFSLPNPIGVYAKRYGLELEYYMSELSIHELERRLHASLYAEFLRRELWNQESQPTHDRKLTMKGILESSLSSQREHINNDQRNRQMRVTINQLLNTPGQNWDPDPSTLPDISYQGELDRLEPSRGYGLLAVKQAAGQMEAALSNVQRARIARFPNFSTGMSVPTLYDSRNTDQRFGTDEIQLFGTMNQSFDLRGTQAERTRTTERRVSLLQSSLRIRLEREMHQLIQSKARYQSLLAERDQLSRLLQWMRKNPPPTANPDVLMARIREQVSLDNRLLENRRQLRQMDLEFWIWDERHWKSPF